jgi:hypothetical protein
MPTITDWYDSNQDPTAASLPPMVDPRLFEGTPPLCMDRSMAGFRRLDAEAVSEAMGVPAPFRVVEPIPDLHSPAMAAEWSRLSRGLRGCSRTVDRDPDGRP